MNVNMKSRCIFTVETEADPQVPCRLLGLFTQRGRLPESFSVRIKNEEVMQIDIEISDLDEDLCELLYRKMLNIPTVIDASSSRISRRVGDR